MLNAFRHLRKEHRDVREQLTDPVLCSTPFGIYGRNTHALQVRAIEVDSCSTPFGIYGRNTGCQARILTVLVSAQRLSASTEGTPQRNGGESPWRDVLNAFRHLRKEHRNHVIGFDRLQSVLNAFRHLRKEHFAPHKLLK